jgi:uncharacterized repeat protein (TIGR04076 family)
MHQSRAGATGSLCCDRRSFCASGIGVAFGMTAFGGSTISGECTTPFDAEDGERKKDMEAKVTAVTAKVISVKGTCGFGHKIGDTAKISESGVEGRICIHALYSMFPAAFAMLYDAKFPWLQNPDVKTHPCTDAANPVVFELTKIRT